METACGGACMPVVGRYYGHAGNSESPVNQATILWGLLFGSIGVGFFMYGKKQKAVVPLACGLLLMAFPYFVSNTLLLVGIGVILMAVPYFVRL